jgi:hypothetical protein
MYGGRAGARDDDDVVDRIADRALAWLRFGDCEESRLVDEVVREGLADWWRLAVHTVRTAGEPGDRLNWLAETLLRAALVTCARGSPCASVGAGLNMCLVCFMSFFVPYGAIISASRRR